MATIYEADEAKKKSLLPGSPVVLDEDDRRRDMRENVGDGSGVLLAYCTGEWDGYAVVDFLKSGGSRYRVLIRSISLDMSKLDMNRVEMPDEFPRPEGYLPRISDGVGHTYSTPQRNQNAEDGNRDLITRTTLTYELSWWEMGSIGLALSRYAADMPEDGDGARQHVRDLSLIFGNGDRITITKEYDY